MVDLAGSDVVDCGSWSEEREAALRACMEDALADDRPARYTRAGSPAAFTIVHEPEAKTFVIRFLPQESVEWSECKDPIMVDGLPDCETYVPALQDLMLACQHSDSCNAIADSEH